MRVWCLLLVLVTVIIIQSSLKVKTVTTGEISDGHVQQVQLQLHPLLPQKMDLFLAQRCSQCVVFGTTRSDVWVRPHVRSAQILTLEYGSHLRPIMHCIGDEYMNDTVQQATVILVAGYECALSAETGIITIQDSEQRTTVQGVPPTNTTGRLFGFCTSAERLLILAYQTDTHGVYVSLSLGHTWLSGYELTLVGPIWQMILLDSAHLTCLVRLDAELFSQTFEVRTGRAVSCDLVFSGLRDSDTEVRPWWVDRQLVGLEVVGGDGIVRRLAPPSLHVDVNVLTMW